MNIISKNINTKTLRLAIIAILCIALICGTIGATILWTTGHFARDIVAARSIEEANSDSAKSLGETAIQYIEKYYMFGYIIGITGAVLMTIASLVSLIFAAHAIIQNRKLKEQSGIAASDASGIQPELGKHLTAGREQSQNIQKPRQ